jgi:hypothetical protein
MTSRMMITLVTGLALLSTGLLAGAFGYGAVNVATTELRRPGRLRVDSPAVGGVQRRPQLAALAAFVLVISLVIRSRHTRPNSREGQNEREDHGQRRQLSQRVATTPACTQGVP